MRCTEKKYDWNGIEVTCGGEMENKGLLYGNAGGAIYQCKNCKTILLN